MSLDCGISIHFDSNWLFSVISCFIGQKLTAPPCHHLAYLFASTKRTILTEENKCFFYSFSKITNTLAHPSSKIISHILSSLMLAICLSPILIFLPFLSFCFLFITKYFLGKFHIIFSCWYSGGSSPFHNELSIRIFSFDIRFVQKSSFFPIKFHSLGTGQCPKGN